MTSCSPCCCYCHRTVEPSSSTSSHFARAAAPSVRRGNRSVPDRRPSWEARTRWFRASLSVTSSSVSGGNSAGEDLALSSRRLFVAYPRRTTDEEAAVPKDRSIVGRRGESARLCSALIILVVEARSRAVRVRGHLLKPETPHFSCRNLSPASHPLLPGVAISSPRVDLTA